MGCTIQHGLLPNATARCEPAWFLCRNGCGALLGVRPDLLLAKPARPEQRCRHSMLLLTRRSSFGLSEFAKQGMQHGHCHSVQPEAPARRSDRICKARYAG